MQKGYAMFLPYFRVEVRTNRYIANLSQFVGNTELMTTLWQKKNFRQVRVRSDKQRAGR